MGFFQESTRKGTARMGQNILRLRKAAQRLGFVNRDHAGQMGRMTLMMDEAMREQARDGGDVGGVGEQEDQGTPYGSDAAPGAGFRL